MSLDASHSSTPNTSRQIVDASLASTEFDPSASARAQARCGRRRPRPKLVKRAAGTSLPLFVVVEGWGRDMLQHPLGQSAHGAVRRVQAVRDQYICEVRRLTLIDGREHGLPQLLD